MNDHQGKRRLKILSDGSNMSWYDNFKIKKKVEIQWQGYLYINMNSVK